MRFSKYRFVEEALCFTRRDMSSTILCKFVGSYCIALKSTQLPRVNTTESPGRTPHDIFARGCATLWSLYRPFLEFLTKSRTLFGIFVPNGGLQNTIFRAVLGKNGFHFPNIFLNLWIFSPN